MPSGGISAAYGFHYQYLVTAVHILRRLREDLSLVGRATLSIEPESVGANGGADDIVDFSIEIDGKVAQRVQVKSSLTPAKYPLQPADAREVFARLCAGEDPGRAILLTNRPLSRDLLRQCAEEVVDVYGSVFGWQPTVAGRPEVQDPSAPSIVVDSRTVRELEQELAILIRGFRRDRALGQGETSSHLLGAIVRHRIFNAAAGLQPQRISALDLVEMLSMPDPQIAHMAGAFDWGIPITGVPSLETTVPRLQILDELTDFLGATAVGRAPQIGVLVGHTGTGKSVIAGDYCHINFNTYEFTCWIDCRDEDLVKARVREITEQLTTTDLKPGTEVAPLFTGALGRHRGPWLIVFDGVSNRADIEKYLPTIGHGSVLVTTTNSLGWWSAARTIEVTAFSPAEAIACFADYAGIAVADLPAVAGSVTEIVDRLGRIPLAVSMAGLYFRNAEGQLSELLTDYFASLDALQDDLAIPAGYGRTAFAAIRYAVNNIGRGANSPYKQAAKGVLYYGSLLAPELIPLNLIIPASAATTHVDVADMPRPVEIEKTLARGVVSVLRTQTIAHRVANPDDLGRSTLASDTIVIHPLVHEILRTSYLASLPAGQLQVAATTLMNFLVPWLGSMRAEGKIFALEQLRVHAEALLAIVEHNEPLASYSLQHDRVFKFVKSGLLMELSACFASTARFDRSIVLASASTQLLLSMEGENAARTLAVKPLTDIVVDLSLGEAPAAMVAAVGSQLVSLLATESKSTRAPSRKLAYEMADQALQMVTRTSVYRDFPSLQHIASSLENIAACNPERSTSVYGLLQRVNALAKRKNYVEVLAMIPQLRAIDESIYDQITFDALEVTAQLYVGEYSEALAGLDRLLAMQPPANHLALQIRAGLIKIAQGVHEVAGVSGSPTALRNSYPRRLQNRIEEITELLDLTDQQRSAPSLSAQSGMSPNSLTP
ncbi:hypothetical protein G9U53_26185 [Rhodococcus sp. D-46]|uniref:hypothetical protein n=1 Tax=Rhodococcus sp. D-46 TaxID=2716265 RepID=UPI0013F68920|nr:hypothetical protein [Rhodococcus sp. D-46]